MAWHLRKEEPRRGEAERNPLPCDFIDDDFAAVGIAQAVGKPAHGPEACHRHGEGGGGQQREMPKPVDQDAKQDRDCRGPGAGGRAQQTGAEPDAKKAGHGSSFDICYVLAGREPGNQADLQFLMRHDLMACPRRHALSSDQCRRRDRGDAFAAPGEA